MKKGINVLQTELHSLIQLIPWQKEIKKNKETVMNNQHGCLTQLNRGLSLQERLIAHHDIL